MTTAVKTQLENVQTVFFTVKQMQFP